MVNASIADFGMKKLILIILLSQISLLFGGQFTLTWDDNSDNEDGFAIERSIDEGQTWEEIGRVGVNISTYIDTNVSPGYTYTYRVFAFNEFGNSGYSNEAAEGAFLPDGTPENLRESIPTTETQ